MKIYDCIMPLNNVIMSVTNKNDKAKIKAWFFLSILFFGNLFLIFSSFFWLFHTRLALKFFFFLLYISSWFSALVNVSSTLLVFCYIRNTIFRQTSLVLVTVTVLVVSVCLNKQKLSKIITKEFIIHKNIE